MQNVVKNTTKWGLIDLIIPHSCRGCGRLGAVICECCKKYNIERTQGDLREKLAVEEAVLDGIFAVGWRAGVLEKVVKDFKYNGAWADGRVLAEMLSEAMDFAPREDFCVVPLPTIGKHVRERGLDHTLVLAKKLARKKNWKMERLLARAADTVQVGAKAAERQEQAKKAYEIVKKVEKGRAYLLLDDVWTTGASMLAAAKVLRGAGAEKVYGLLIEAGKPRTGGG